MEQTHKRQIQLLQEQLQRNDKGDAALGVSSRAEQDALRREVVSLRERVRKAEENAAAVQILQGQLDAMRQQATEAVVRAQAAETKLDRLREEIGAALARSR